MKRVAENAGWVDYMIIAAQHSKYNAQHWFRYLRKFVDKCGIAFSLEDVNRLYNDDRLTLFQRITLIEAFREGSDTQEYIRSLNRKARPTMLAEIRSRYESKQHHRG
jgi:hypothetical protein